MSIKQIEARVCDADGNIFEGQPEWLTLVHANSETEFDFCTFECLEKWVTSEDEPSDVASVSEDGMEYELPEEIVEAAQAEAQQPVADTTQPAPRPAMTLADAIMMGQKPGFDPMTQKPSDDATRGRG